MDEKVRIEDGINQIKVIMESVPSMKRCRVGMDFLSSVKDYLLQHPDQIERYINLLRNTLNKDVFFRVIFFSSLLQCYYATKDVF